MSNPTNQTDNNNSQFDRKPTMQEVDDLAAALCSEYSNPDFYRWYCRAINVLGIRRINEIRGMYKDTRHARNLFSRRASEEMKAKVAQQKLINLRQNHGKSSS